MPTIRALSLDEAGIKNEDTNKSQHGLTYHSRTAFIIWPMKHFRLIVRFPATVDRRSGEGLRLIDALQTAAHAEYVSPSLVSDTVLERGVDIKYDFFVTNPSLESRGVRVTLHSSNPKI